MATWDREASWRQGSVVSAEAARALGVIEDNNSHPVVVVISHDCDVLQPPEVEPHVEVICGRRLERIDGSFEFGKNPRKLHLPFRTSAGDIAVELEATKRFWLPKVTHGEPGLAQFEPVPTGVLAGATARLCVNG